jgi:hypothetical protein
MARLLTHPTLAVISPTRPASAKTDSSPWDAPCPRQGRSSEADPRFTFHASRFTVPESDARTPLADFFSTLLGAAAFWTKRGFFCCFTLLGGQGEELFALPAGANFEVGGSLIVDVGGQKQLQRVISDRAAVGEFDDGQAVVKDLERSFLPFSG